MEQEVLTRPTPVTTHWHRGDNRGVVLLDRPYDAERLLVVPTLHMQLLGDFQLTSGNTRVTAVDLPRLQSLLAYLVLHHSAPQSRSYLAYLLWPDSTESQAHTNLRSLVHRLRHTLPDADCFLHADRQTLQWQPDASWTLDVLDFERAITYAHQVEQTQNPTAIRAALEKALALYQGDLLPSCYDEWILPERDRLSQAFLGALQRLIELLEQERDYNAAIRAAKRLLHHDPMEEATYRHLMRLYAARGDRASAVHVYHTCATVLERELAVKPSLATREVYELIVQKGSPTALKDPPMARTAMVPLVGRQQEWAQLQAAWRSAAAGRACMVVVSGEAGIGKTRLAEELLAWIEQHSIATAHARCYATGEEQAYAPVAAWLHADALQTSWSTLADVWLTELARLIPELVVERPDLSHPALLRESWQPQRLFEALARAILGSRRPLLLLLDDLQWCDQEALEWLHYLLRFDPQAQVLLVATVRPEETMSGHPLTSFLRALRRNNQVTEIALGPLDAANTTSLAEHVVGRHLDSGAAENLYRETEGNPLFVVETLRAGVLESKTKNSQSLNEILAAQRLSLPPTVQSAITARLAQLSPHARELVDVASVIGRAFTFAALAQASGDDEELLVRGLDELLQRRIVREQGAGTYDFSHNKLREVAYISLSPTRRRLLHRRMEEVLEVVHGGKGLIPSSVR